MATDLTAAEIIRRAQASPADTDNDDEVEAGLRADPVRIDETLAFVNNDRRPPSGGGSRELGKAQGEGDRNAADAPGSGA